MFSFLNKNKKMANKNNMVGGNYLFSFRNVDNKLVKANKSFKSKNNYSMVQAEELVLWIQNNYGYAVIDIACVDTEQAIRYDFDNIEVTTGEPFSIISEMKRQIELNAHLIENVGQLTAGLNRQYQNEVEDADKQPQKNKGQSTSFKMNTSSTDALGVNSRIKRVEYSEKIDNLFYQKG